jgi:hypothetical protein
MPERETAQERPERRRREHAVAHHAIRLADPQHITVVDRVRAEQHRVHQREHFRTRPRPRRAIGERDRLIDETLDTEPITERRCEHHPGIGDGPLVVEDGFQPVQPTSAATRRIRHHQGDLLSAGPAAAQTARLACSGGHIDHHTGRHPGSHAVYRG